MRRSDAMYLIVWLSEVIFVSSANEVVLLMFLAKEMIEFVVVIRGFLFGVGWVEFERDC